MKEITDFEEFDFGFTSVAEEDITAPVAGQVQAANDKAALMYKMILPLLNNLKKDADKNAYIHWPDRKVKIDQFIQKLNTILNS